MIHDDFSNWPETLFDYSINLLKTNSVLTFIEVDQVFIESNSATSTYNLWLKKPHEAQIWWLTIGLGVECLAKSTLLRHECLKIDRKNLLTQASQCSIPDVKAIYSGAQSVKITSEHNTWLQQQITNTGICCPHEIKTPTLGSIQSDFKHLETAGVITQYEYNEIRQWVQVFTDIRRNVDAHLFLKTTTIRSFNGDFDKVLLPLINQLLNVYNR